MKKIKKQCIFLFICFVLVTQIDFPSQATNLSGKKVRVAYFNLGSYYQEKEDGTVESYDSAYLEIVRHYTGLQFEYVNCETWSNALAMMERHEIDLVGTMQWTQEREDRYEICDASYGYTLAELAALADSHYIYEDYEGMNGATVGYMKGYVVGDKLQDLMKNHNISFQLITFDTQQALDAALENGDIDFVAANSHAIKDEWKIIEKFAYAPFHFASWKGNSELTECISEAIIQINIHQSDVDDNLIKQYFPRMVNSPYNKKEMDCIGENRTYTIYFDPNTKPVIWYNEETETMEGVLAVTCEQLELTTGLHFELRPRTEYVEQSNPNSVTYRTLYYENGSNASQEEGVSDTILDQTFKLFHCVGEKYETDGSYVIALVNNRSGIKAYLQKKYPNCTLVEYESPASCIEHVALGEADLAFINAYIAENVIITNNLNEIAAVPMTEAIIGIALQFRGEDAELLAGIVDKGMKLIDVDAVNEAMLQYAMNTSPRMTLPYLIQQNVAIFIGVWLLIILVLIVCCSLFIYARLMKLERNRMEEINRERSDFFARMSHDMRTPMNGILGMIELTGQAKDLDEVRDNMKKAELSGQYMLSLINDTLDLQRLESKKLTLEPQIVYVKDFIDNITEMIRPSAEQKHINFIVANKEKYYEYYVKIDQVRVKQIFVNILSNAVKFTQENGTIETTIERLALKNHMASVKITISDTGIGMSSKFIQESLYKPYSQEHNKMTNRYAGSGLGLAIVKNLVELMGGRIEVESEIGEGTCFIVYLEFEQVDEEVARKKLLSKNSNLEKIQHKLHGKKILVCEDHPLNAEIIQRLLEKNGCKTVLAANGKEGVEIFENAPLGGFDAILMDIRMPVMDGLEAASAIRVLAREDAKTIPIIAMTANAYDTDKDNSKRAGMNAHLAKPIDVNALYTTLESLIIEGDDTI